LKSDLSQAQIESVSIYNSANGNSDIWHNVAVNNDGTVTVWNTNGGSTYSLENLLNYEISGSNLYLYF